MGPKINVPNPFIRACVIIIVITVNDYFITRHFDSSISKRMSQQHVKMHLAAERQI